MRWPLYAIILLSIGLSLWHQSSAWLGAPLVRASTPSEGTGSDAKRASVVDLKAYPQGASCFHFVATVTNGGTPVVSTPVNFNVTSGPHNGQMAFGVPTDVNGQATWDLCDATATTGVDSVTAMDYMTGSSATVTVDWGSAIVMDLSADPQVGICYHVIATLNRAGVPLQGIGVNFVVTSGPHAGQGTSATTNANGQATWDLCDATAPTGDDLVTATATSVGKSATVTVQWGEYALDLTADPYDAACYWLGAKLTRGGVKVTNTIVTFKVVSGPHAGQVTQASTGEYGQAEWNFCAPGSVGVDVITASTDWGTTDLVTLDWGSGVILTLTTDSRGNSCYRLTAKLTREGYRYPGQNVEFAVTSGPHRGQGTTVTTDLNGQAYWDLCGQGSTGIDEVTVKTYGASDIVSLDWGSGLMLKLVADYDQGTYCYWLRATLTKNGAPCPGVRVDYTVTSGPHAGKTFQATTNSQGEAFPEYCGDGSLGTDKVMAAALGLKSTVNVDWSSTTQQQVQQDANSQTGCAKCMKDSGLLPNWSSK